MSDNTRIGSCLTARTTRRRRLSLCKMRCSGADSRFLPQGEKHAFSFLGQKRKSAVFQTILQREDAELSSRILRVASAARKSVCLARGSEQLRKTHYSAASWDSVGLSFCRPERNANPAGNAFDVLTPPFQPLPEEPPGKSLMESHGPVGLCILPPAVSPVRRYIDRVGGGVDGFPKRNVVKERKPKTVKTAIIKTCFARLQPIGHILFRVV